MFRELLTRLITADRTEALGGEGLTQFAANTNRKLTLVSSAPVALSCTPAQCQCGTRNTHGSFSHCPDNAQPLPACVDQAVVS